jgi:hypothetical protein
MSKPNTAVKLIRELFDKAQDKGVLWEVWHIVSALRGPDDDDDFNKEKFTIEIRKVVITTKQGNKVGLYPWNGKISSSRKNKLFRDGLVNTPRNHYGRHISHAVDAINKNI